MTADETGVALRRATDAALSYLASEGHDVGPRLERDMEGAIESALEAHESARP